MNSIEALPIREMPTAQKAGGVRTTFAVWLPASLGALFLG